MEQIAKRITYFILFIFLCIISYHYGKINGLKECSEIINQNSTQETYTHYISDVIFDTVFQDKYIPYYETDTLYLNDTITNTTTDTLFIKDTVFLPNQVSIKDTVFNDTLNNHIINNELYIKLSGYQVSLDTLRLNTSITSITQNKKWYNRIVPAIGVGVGLNGRAGVFIGVGYRIQ